ncbi:hypothetical protein GDO81_016848 [Engystomops pustulosus]|uniref:RRM domain-containing protein n=1 Tax=Engystomops pustulosus TaxID=76066 RepID=A0AAV7A8Z0_ENGPU|nr:hypothetical protein GDO81_016848 [Engystomops pustulosus]
MEQHKGPLSSDEEETQTSSKKRRIEHNGSQEAVNGLSQWGTKKSPRLSPALFCDDCEIQHIQLHRFLKYAVIGKKSSAPQASWCSIHHQKRLRGVVVIVLEDLAQHHFYQFYSHFRFFRRLFRHRFSLPPSRSDFIASLLGLNGVNVQAQKKKVDDDRTQAPTSDDPILQRYGTDRQDLTRYLLTEEEMMKNDYPFVGSLNTENYVHTMCTAKPTDSSPLYGLDCEMCLTAKGNELTRVAVVDARGQCIMDELVKPHNPIINYLTSFSGITKKMLHRVKTTLKDVQDRLKSLLPPDAILVGHSLNFDLRALQMIHPHVIDTSVLFARKYDKKFRLKFLAQEILKREIQRPDAVGHNPLEDATAALHLAQYIIEHGPQKVADIELERIFLNGSDVQKTPDITKVNGILHPLPSEGPGFLEELEKGGQKIVYVSRDALTDPVPLSQFQTLLCSSDDEVLEKACGAIPLSPINIVKFQPRSKFSKWPIDANGKVASKFAELMTVFAGPFKDGVNPKSVKMHFESCGPIHSLTTISDTCQPYLCVRFCVPEAAQLAVEHLNGSCVDGCHVKVQRMITRRTIDYQDRFKEMEEDPENENTIYVSGFTNPLTEETLHKQFHRFKEIKSIFVPRNPKSRHPAKYCYLKFHSPDAAAAAITHIQTHGGLRSMKAITSSHFHRWLQTAVTHVPLQTPSNQDVMPGEDLTEIIKDLDRKLHQLYECLVENTLCVALFPGNNSSDGSVPGFGLMGIKS